MKNSADADRAVWIAADTDLAVWISSDPAFAAGTKTDTDLAVGSLSYAVSASAPGLLRILKLDFGLLRIL